MNDRLIALAKPNLNYTKAEIQSKRAEILVEGIGKMNEFLQNAEKEAGKDKFSKVMKVLKSALKVIGTLGLNKSAKLELAAATFLMDEKNVAKIKGVAQKVSRDLKTSVAFINEKKNEKGMGR
jgi:hypothetical protein